jgi:hypothetical protein
MMRKWLIGVFVFAFSLGFSGMVFAFSKSESCHAYSQYNVWKYCTVKLHVGDNKAGGLDDYDFTWQTVWHAVDSNTIKFSKGYFTATDVESGNKDYIYSHSIGTKYIAMYNTKLIGLNYSKNYGFTQDDTLGYGFVAGNVTIYDPETKIYHVAREYFYMK